MMNFQTTAKSDSGSSVAAQQKLDAMSRLAARIGFSSGEVSALEKIYATAFRVDGTGSARQRKKGRQSE